MKPLQNSYLFSFLFGTLVLLGDIFTVYAADLPWVALGLQPSISTTFALSSQQANSILGFGVTLELRNDSTRAIDGWEHTNSPIGLIVVRLEELQKNDTKVLDDAAFTPGVFQLQPAEVARNSIMVLSPGGIAVVRIPVTIVTPKQKTTSAVDPVSFRVPYAIERDGEFRVVFIHKASGLPIGTITFEVKNIQEETPVVIMKTGSR